MLPIAALPPAPPAAGRRQGQGHSLTFTWRCSLLRSFSNILFPAEKNKHLHDIGMEEGFAINK